MPLHDVWNPTVLEFGPFQQLELSTAVGFWVRYWHLPRVLDFQRSPLVPSEPPFQPGNQPSPHPGKERKRAEPEVSAEVPYLDPQQEA